MVNKIIRLLVVVVFLLASANLWADTLTVTFCGDGGSESKNPGMLRNRINSAKSGDTIVIPDFKEFTGEACIIKLAGVAGESNNAGGDFDIFKKDLTIEAEGDGTIIDGQGADRIFDITQSKVTLKNLTIQNGSATDGGGGIRISTGSTVTITNSTISGNKASPQQGYDCAGGGVLNSWGSTLIIDSSLISKNQVSSQGGGGIANCYGGTVTLNKSVVNENTGPASSAGGGIYNQSNKVGEYSNIFKINGSLILKNKAQSGAGIYNGATMEINNSSTIENSSSQVEGSGDSGAGGGVINDGDIKIIGSTIRSNITGENQGGGIYNSKTAHIVNTTISGNKSKSAGGGISSYGTMNIYNSTISGNHSGYDNGGGIITFGSLSIHNSILAGNVKDKDGSVSNCMGAIDSKGYNLIDAVDSICKFKADSGDIVGTVEEPKLPMLGELANNGGYTETHALLAGSPAIDAGNPAGCKDNNEAVLTADQRGEKRGSKCDIGAFEYPKPVISSSGTVIDLGSVIVGESSSYELTAYNKGSADLTISSSTLSDTVNFAMTKGGSNPCKEPLIIAPSSSCTGLIAFNPASANTFNATLTVTSNDSDTPSLVIALSGIGAAKAEEIAKTEETAETQAQCGDGITFAGSEECDDGNVVAGDGCDASCKKEVVVSTGSNNEQATVSPVAESEQTTASGSGVGAGTGSGSSSGEPPASGGKASSEEPAATTAPASGGGCSLVR